MPNVSPIPHKFDGAGITVVAVLTIYPELAMFILLISLTSLKLNIKGP